MTLQIFHSNRGVCVPPQKLLGLWLLIFLLPPSAGHPGYQYFRIGQATDISPHPTPGIALMGGGSDIDDAFRWLCEKANRGDFLILRARGDDAYNSYVKPLCKLNSVATLIIPDRHAAQDAAVANIIRHAEAVFIAGGDQARYLNSWRGTPVQDAINGDIGDGKPIGGTSAGLAILGQFSYGALNDPPDDSNLTSADALRDPFAARVTLVRDFLRLPLLRDTITDSHFAKRDRLGRSLVFLARLMQDGWSRNPREIAIDEKSAVLIEPDGEANVVGSGQGAYFLRPTEPPAVCQKGVPLTFQNISVHKAPSGAHFNLSAWSGEGGFNYSLSVQAGTVSATQPGSGLY